MKSSSVTLGWSKIVCRPSLLPTDLLFLNHEGRFYKGGRHSALVEEDALTLSQQTSS